MSERSGGETVEMVDVRVIFRTAVNLGRGTVRHAHAPVKNDGPEFVFRRRRRGGRGGTRRNGR